MARSADVKHHGEGTKKTIRGHTAGNLKSSFNNHGEPLKVREMERNVSRACIRKQGEDRKV